MSWTPTDEQDVATALDPYVTLPADKRDWSASMRDAYEHHAVTDFTEAYAAARRVYLREAARAVLVAVGPHIAAQALRDAAAVQDEESARIREAYRQHNASRDPNRPPRRPDLNVWSNADEATAHRLRARADTIEKEAGR